MRVPCETHLISQSFNSKFIEFVWQFPRTSGHKDQFIAQIHLNPWIYMEAGVVDESGEYTHDPDTFEVGYGHLGAEGFLTNGPCWKSKNFPAMYNYFTNGKDLVPLVEDVVNYLQSL